MFSILRRAEQAILQQVGVVSSSYDANADFRLDESRWQALDDTVKALCAALSSHLLAGRKLAESSKVYSSALQAASRRGCDLSGLCQAAEILEFATKAAETYVSEGSLARLGRISRSIAGLRGEISVRKDRVLDHDSYVRRVSQAESALSSARDQVSVMEARDALRKAKVKVVDAVAGIARMSEAIRARLTAVECELQSAAVECGAASVAAAVHVGSASSEAYRRIMPSHPAAATHAVLLASACHGRAVVSQPAIINACLLRPRPSTQELEEGTGSPSGPVSSSRVSLLDALRSPTGSALPHVSFDSLHSAVRGGWGCGPSPLPRVGTGSRALLRAGMPGPMPGSGGGSGPGTPVGAEDVLEGEGAGGEEGSQAGGEKGGSGRSTPVQG